MHKAIKNNKETHTHTHTCGDRDSSEVRAWDSWSKGLGFEFEYQQKWWDNFLLQGKLSVLIFQYPFHPHGTTVACKRSWSFCQKCRQQVTAKHACILPMWLCIKWQCKVVHGWMVYTELALREQQFPMVPAMQQPKSTTSTPFPWILKIWAIKKDIVTHSESHHMPHVHSESASEQKIAIIINIYGW